MFLTASVCSTGLDRLTDFVGTERRRLRQTWAKLNRSGIPGPRGNSGLTLTQTFRAFYYSRCLIYSHLLSRAGGDQNSSFCQFKRAV